LGSDGLLGAGGRARVRADGSWVPGSEGGCGTLDLPRAQKFLTTALHDSRFLHMSLIHCVRCTTGGKRADRKRPDGATLVPWKSERCLALDTTCPDTYAQSAIRESSVHESQCTLSGFQGGTQQIAEVC